MWSCISRILGDNPSELRNVARQYFAHLNEKIDLDSIDIQDEVKSKLLPPSVIWNLGYQSRYWYLINIATFFGRLEGVRTLLALDPNLANNADISLAIILPAIGKESMLIIQSLLEAGANPNGNNSDMLHILYSQDGLNMQYGDSIRRMVLRYGANPNLKSISGHKPHENLCPQNEEEAKHIVTLVQYGAIYSKNSIGQLLEYAAGSKILAHIDCSQIPKESIATKVRAIMSSYTDQKRMGSGRFPNRFTWEKQQLLEFKRVLKYKVNKMHSGKEPTPESLRKYHLYHLPDFIHIIHYLATWIKVCERRIDGDETIAVRNAIASVNFKPKRVKSLKLLSLQQVHCNKFFGPILLSA